MGIFQQFPYSNFHEFNLDQIIKIMREMQDEWTATKTEWASYKDFIDNYFANLDLSAEVLAAIRTMAANGSLNTVIDPTIATETAKWLNENITPTTPAVDSSLTIAGAAADSKTVGDKFIEVIENAETDNNLLGFSVFNKNALILDNVTTEVSGYRLKSDGCAAVNANYYLTKYAVHAGDLLYINITKDETETVETDTATFQFQNGAQVPYSIDGNPNLKGPVYTHSYTGFVTVPDDANYLIMTRTNNTTTNYVKHFLRQNDVLIAIGGSSGSISIEGNVFKTNANIYIYPYPYQGEYYSVNFAGTGFERVCADNSTLCIDLSKAGHNVLGDPSIAATAFVDFSYGNIPPGYLPIMQYRATNGGTYVYSSWLQFMKRSAGTNYIINPSIGKLNLIAHRGGNFAGENTIANFTAAINAGYEILECDIRFTNDDIAVLSHDDTFTINGVSYTISQMTYAQIYAINPSIPKLTDMLMLCKRNNVVAELDCANITSAQTVTVSTIVTEMGMNGKTIITGAQSAIRNALNNNNHIVSVSGITSISALSGISDIINNSIACIASTRNDYITEALVTAIHSSGCICKTYTVNTVAAVNNMIDAGVDLIITDSVRPQDL